MRPRRVVKGLVLLEQSIQVLVTQRNNVIEQLIGQRPVEPFHRKAKALQAALPVAGGDTMKFS